MKQTEHPHRRMRAKHTEQQNRPDKLNNKVSPATLKKHNFQTTLKSSAVVTSSPAFSGTVSCSDSQSEETPADMPAKVVAFFSPKCRNFMSLSRKGSTSRLLLELILDFVTQEIQPEGGGRRKRKLSTSRAAAVAESSTAL